MEIRFIDVINENLATDQEIYLICLLNVKRNISICLSYLEGKPLVMADSDSISFWKSHRYIIKDDNVSGYHQRDLV